MISIKISHRRAYWAYRYRYSSTRVLYSSRVTVFEHYRYIDNNIDRYISIIYIIVQLYVSIVYSDTRVLEYLVLKYSSTVLEYLSTYEYSSTVLEYSSTRVNRVIIVVSKYLTGERIKLIDTRVLEYCTRVHEYSCTSPSIQKSPQYSSTQVLE